MQVTCHLIKLFDNTADLKFQDNEDEHSNIVLGMYSKEKEYVPFSGQLKCSGQVCDALKCDIFLCVLKLENNKQHLTDTILTRYTHKHTHTLY